MSVTIEVYDPPSGGSPTHIEIISEQPFRDKPLIVLLPGAKYNIAQHRWLAPLTWAACRQLRGIFGDRLVIGPKLEAWAWEERNSRVGPAMALRAAWDIEDDDSPEAEVLKSWRSA